MGVDAEYEKLPKFDVDYSDFLTLAAFVFFVGAAGLYIELTQLRLAVLNLDHRKPVSILCPNDVFVYCPAHFSIACCSGASSTRAAHAEHHQCSREGALGERHWATTLASRFLTARPTSAISRLPAPALSTPSRSKTTAASTACQRQIRPRPSRPRSEGVQNRCRPPAVRTSPRNLRIPCLTSHIRCFRESRRRQERAPIDCLAIGYGPGHPRHG